MGQDGFVTVGSRDRKRDGRRESFTTLRPGDGILIDFRCPYTV